MSKKLKLIAEKLSEILSEEDLTQITETIEEMVTEKVTEKVAEEKVKLEILGEEYCEQKIQEGITAKEEALIEDYDKKLVDLEDVIVEKLDKFLDLEISSKISDEMLKTVAVNETYLPIVEGIKSLFEDQYVGLDCEGEKTMRRSEDKIKELEESASSIIAEKIELAESMEGLKSDLLISEKIADLTESERARVKKFCEGKKIEELTAEIDSIVEVVVESSSFSSANKDGVVVESVGSKDETTIADDSVVAEDDGIVESTVGTPDSVKEEDAVIIIEDQYTKAESLL